MPYLIELFPELTAGTYNAPLTISIDAIEVRFPYTVVLKVIKDMLINEAAFTGRMADYPEIVTIGDFNPDTVTFFVDALEGVLRVELAIFRRAIFNCKR